MNVRVSDMLVCVPDDWNLVKSLAGWISTGQLLVSQSPGQAEESFHEP